jgi:DNA-binding SARP family transcriptional activator
MLRLRLLGGLELIGSAGQTVNFVSRKDAALLAFLAMRDHPVDRSEIADLLWGDRAEEQARKSLRQALVSLRQLLNQGAEVLTSTRRQSIALNRDELWIDARAFEDAIRAGQTELASSLHRGPLLGNFRCPTPAFENWLQVERTRLDDLASGAFIEAAQNRLVVADWDQAEESARRAIEINAFNEEAHQLLMRAKSGAGKRNEALQQYHRLYSLLRDELDVRPTSETTALYHRIKREGESQRTVVSGPGSESETSITAQPGLAVLPLQFVEDGHEDEALADALTGELIASLAAYRWFFVTSALQAAAYRNRPFEPRQLHDELGVRYVLTGVLRRSANHLAIRLDLSDPITGQHLWSERLKCFLDEALEAQDALAHRIAAAIEPELIRSEDEITHRIPLQNFSRWERLARARLLAEQGDRQALTKGVEIASDVVRRHPDCAYAQATLAWNAWLKFMIAGRPADSYDSDYSVVAEGVGAAETARKLDPRFYLANAALGGWNAKLKDYEAASTALRRSIDLNPSFPTSYNQLVSCLTRAGQPRDALGWIKQLDRISPSDVYRGYYCCVRALTHFCLRNDEAAITNAEESLRAHPGWLSSELLLIAASRRHGDRKRAEEASARLVAARGKISRAQLRELYTMRRANDFEALAKPLADAGVLAR